MAINGANGSGKSSLLKALLGKPCKTSPSLTTGSLNTITIDQNCAALDSEKSILENIQPTSQLSESDIRSNLAEFLFTNEIVFQKVKDLSGGERLRSALAKGFLKTEKPELMILDEPTNNLDLPNIEFLEALVRNFVGALIVISHDPVFLRNHR